MNSMYECPPIVGMAEPRAYPKAKIYRKVETMLGKIVLLGLRMNLMISRRSIIDMAINWLLTQFTPREFYEYVFQARLCHVQRFYLYAGSF